MQVKNFLFLVFIFTIGTSTAQKSAAEYVNPMIGASTSTSKAQTYHGLGKTFPGATTPFGMTQVSKLPAVNMQALIYIIALLIPKPG